MYIQEVLLARLEELIGTKKKTLKLEDKRYLHINEKMNTIAYVKRNSWSGTETGFLNGQLEDISIEIILEKINELELIQDILQKGKKLPNEIYYLERPTQDFYYSKKNAELFVIEISEGKTKHGTYQKYKVTEDGLIKK